MVSPPGTFETILAASENGSPWADFLRRLLLSASLAGSVLPNANATIAPTLDSPVGQPAGPQAR